MRRMRGMGGLGASACAALLLCACQSTPVAAPASGAGDVQPSPLSDSRDDPRALAAAGLPVYTLRPEASRVRVYVFRGGKAARAGHNHVLDVKQFEGYVAVDAEQPQGSQFHLRVPLAELVVDDPGSRAQTGGAFGGVRSESDIEGTRRNLLGPRGLDASRFAHVELRSQRVAGDWPMLVIDVSITLKGVTRVLPVLVEVRMQKDALRARGEFVLRQSEFGIEPFSVLGGLMAVQDAVGIVFELTGTRGL